MKILGGQKIPKFQAQNDLFTGKMAPRSGHPLSATSYQCYGSGLMSRKIRPSSSFRALLEEAAEKGEWQERFPGGARLKIRKGTGAFAVGTKGVGVVHAAVLGSDDRHDTADQPGASASRAGINRL